MALLHVCPLRLVEETVQATGARHMVTLLNVGAEVSRPRAIASDRHLVIGMSDVVAAQEGHVSPAKQHLVALLDFANSWDRTSPLLLHCWAGVSRSTAGAFIIACALRPERCEADIAAEIRSKSPTATPNALMVALADAHLNRNGRMSAAIAAIGRGAECFEGRPFSLNI